MTISLRSTMKWCRPDVTEPTDDSTENMEASLLSNQSDKLMIIRNGRCPLNVFESTGFVSDGGPTEFIPNDTYASYEKFFTVVTGINGMECNREITVRPCVLF